MDTNPARLSQIDIKLHIPGSQIRIERITPTVMEAERQTEIHSRHDRCEDTLTNSLPNLQLDPSAFNIDSFSPKLEANGRRVLHHVSVLCEAKKQTGLAHT